MARGEDLMEDHTSEDFLILDLLFYGKAGSLGARFANLLAITRQKKKGKKTRRKRRKRRKKEEKRKNERMYMTLLVQEQKIE